MGGWKESLELAVGRRQVDGAREAGSRAAVPEGCLDKRSAKVREEVRLALDEWRAEHTIERVREHYAQSDPAYMVLEQATGGCLDTIAAAIASALAFSTSVAPRLQAS